MTIIEQTDNSGGTCINFNNIYDEVKNAIVYKKHTMR